MLLEQTKTTVAYRCPHCGAGIMSPVGVFKLNADRLVLKCQCGHSEMSITRSKDEKIRLEVPCLICRAPHNYTLTEGLFFSGKLFLLPCHVSGLDICMLGSQEDVSDALDRTAEELTKMLEEAGLDTLDVFHPAKEDIKELPDAQIYDILNLLVRELEYDHKILCECGAGPYDVFFSEDGEHIVVACEGCGCSCEFPADSVSAAVDFLNIDEIVLK